MVNKRWYLESRHDSLLTNDFKNYLCPMCYFPVSSLFEVYSYLLMRLFVNRELLANLACLFIYNKYNYSDVARDSTFFWAAYGFTVYIWLISAFSGLFASFLAFRLQSLACSWNTLSLANISMHTQIVFLIRFNICFTTQRMFYNIEWGLKGNCR